MNNKDISEKSLLTSLCKGEELPLFDKWFDETHHPELVEGVGQACLPRPRSGPEPVGRGRFSNDYVNSILEPFIS